MIGRPSLKADTIYSNAASSIGDHKQSAIVTPRGGAKHQGCVYLILLRYRRLLNIPSIEKTVGIVPDLSRGVSRCPSHPSINISPRFI